MGVSDPHPFGFDLVWQLTEATTGREVARGKHGVVTFDIHHPQQNSGTRRVLGSRWAERFGETLAP